jgi:crotonobetainyl-CoA:carnitine CoA-transferase CaiB-like acyl-CoA transferase
MLPLQGLRVLAVEQYGAGPFGTQYLADLGAEVIKIENPNVGGDYARYVGPYFIEGAEGTANSLFFQGCNRNKRSLTLDLSQPRGQDVFHDLVKTAEAVTHNLRGDVPKKLGLRYADLKHYNPAIVCAHLTAYGRDNERENWPGFDYLMQAEAGYFSITGEPGTPPARMGLSIVDYMTGLTMAYAILAGVLQARACGEGRDIDTSLFDTALFNLNYLASWYLANGHVQQREERSAHPSLTPCALYKTGDGWIFLMCNKEKFWPALCGKIDRPEWIDDPRFRTFEDRLQHRPLLTELLDEALSRRTTSEWLRIFKGSVPAAPLLNVGEALENPFVRDRDRIQALRHQSGAPFELLATPVQLSGDKIPDKPAPEMGADSDELLRELGYDDDRIHRLRQDRIV